MHSMDVNDEDFSRCRPLTFGGARADLAALVMPAPSRTDHPYRACRPNETCTVDSIVLSRLIVLADLPFSLVTDTLALVGTVPADLDLTMAYLQHNHLARECEARMPGPKPAANAQHFGPYVGSAEACATLHGRWEVFAPTGGRYCVVPTSDGGKACRDTVDCQGFCVVAPGPRAPVAPGTMGPGACAAAFQQDCFQYVIRSTAQPRVCVAGLDRAVGAGQPP